jgi:hypothetical protein
MNKDKLVNKSTKKRKGNEVYDILEIHNNIMTMLDREYDQIVDLKKQLKKLDWIYKNSDNDTERQLAHSKIIKLHPQIEIIESGIKQARYIHRTEDILKKYVQILEQPIKIDFMGNKLSEENKHKQKLIEEYLSIASDYIDIQPSEPKKTPMNCKDCNIELQKEDDYLFVCPNCGLAIKHFASMASYNENNRINVAQRYVYDKRGHFNDSIKKFQGKQNTTISDEVYTDLREKIKCHDISIEKLTKDHIYEFLKLTGHSDHYEDITLIYSELTHISPPNISHLEQKLFELYDEIDPVYERVKPMGRVNFLNGQFVLFKLLQKLKFPCKEDDFYILKTREKMLEHDQIWKQICAELSWTYIATV